MPSLDDLVNNPDLPAIDHNSLSAGQLATLDDLLKRRAAYCRQGRAGDVQAIDQLIIEGFRRGRPPSANPLLSSIPAAEPTDSQPKDPSEAFKREYREGIAVYQKFGVSEEDYVRSRRIDAGLEQLLPVAAAS